MTTILALDPPAPVMLRCKMRAKITHLTRTGAYTLQGATDHDAMPHLWTKTGHYDDRPGHPHPLDIVAHVTSDGELVVFSSLPNTPSSNK